MSNVLVTGGTGYLATYVIQKLLMRGYVVRATVRNKNSAKVDLLKEGCGLHAFAGKILLFEADLESDAGWNEAAAGCAYVIHMAAPIDQLTKVKKDTPEERALIENDKTGTLRVLRAAAASGTCKRIVVTCSTATIIDESGSTYDLKTKKGVNLTEDDHAVMEESSGYKRSKIVCELAAWEFCKSVGLEMATVHPSYVLGPSLNMSSRSTSQDMIDEFLIAGKVGLQGGKTGKPPQMLNVNNPFVDVRDVAYVHVEAMLRPEAAGQRFIAHAKSVRTVDMMRELEQDFPQVKALKESGCCIPCLLTIFSKVDRSAAYLKSIWGDTSVEYFDNSKSRRLLGAEYRPVAETVRDHAACLVKLGALSCPAKPLLGNVAINKQ